MLVISLISILLLVPNAIAYDVVSTLSNIDHFAMKTGMEKGQTALYKTYALFDSDKLPDFLRVESEQSVNWFCATTVILDIKQASQVAAPEIQEKISQYLHESPSEKAFADFTTILGFNPGGSYTTNSYQTEHFNFKWGPNYTFSPFDIALWGVTLEEIWTITVDGWGYDPVLFSDQYYVDVYMANTGDSTPEMGGVWAYSAAYPNNQPYMVFHPDYIEDWDNLKNVSAHEFYHLLQHTAAHKPGGCPAYMASENAWGIEGTATWVLDAVYDQSDYYIADINPYAANPYIALNTMDSGHVYSRLLFWKYVSENFGGNSAIYDLWNEGCHGTFMNAVGNIFMAAGSNLVDEFPKFVIANLFLDYEEGSLYPHFYIQSTVNNYPETYVPNSYRKPQMWGTNYIKLNPPSDKAGKYTLDIAFTGDTYQESLPVYWYVQIAAMTGANSYDLYDLDVDSGYGQISLEEFGTDYSKVYLAISPYALSLWEFTGLDYSVSLSVTYHPADDDDDATDDDDSSDDDNDDQSNCENICQRIDLCNLAERLDMSSESECMAICDGVNFGETYYDCATSAGNCSDLRNCFGLDDDKEKDDDADGCGC